MSNHSVETVTTSADKARLVVALIAVLAGVIGFYLLAGQTTLVRAAALVGGLLVAIAVAWTTALGQDFVGFARESVRETRKVVWPTRKEAVQMTLYVFGFVVLMALFLWLTDKTLEWVLYDLILGWR